MNKYNQLALYLIKTLLDMKNIIFSVAIIVLTSCQFENIDPLNPIMVTNEPANIGANTARLGGNVLGEGGLPVTEYGVVYGLNNPPSVNDTKIVEGSGLGNFSNIYFNFQENTQYFYSAYGINEMGIGYGQVFSFVTDQGATCNPDQENFIDLGTEIQAFNSLPIDDVNLFTESIPFSDANIEFVTFTNSNAAKIRLQFKESGQVLPLSGVYTSVADIDNQSPFSAGEVIIWIEDFNGLGGGQASAGEQIFVETSNDEVTFVFCDVAVNQNYLLNGKYTYSD